jgi:TRAP-type transport system periplasmic protein
MVLFSRRFRQLSGVALMTLAAALFTPVGVGAQEQAATEEFPEMTLRSAQGLVSTGFAQEAHQWWADEITKRTGGKVKIETFWAGSLIAARDIPSAVAAGAVEIGHVPSTYDPARTRLWMTLDMPFNVRDHYCGMVAARRVAQENENLIEEFKRNNMLPVVGYNSGFQQFAAKEPIPTVESLQGKRMRSYGGARIALHEKLGITPVFMPFIEIYEAIERGVIDGSADVAIYLGNAFKLHEVAPHFQVADSGVAVAAPLAVFNLQVWEGLPDNLKQVIREVSEEHDMRFARELIKQETDILKSYEDNPAIEVYRLSEEDRAAMETVGKEVQEEWIAGAEDPEAARNVWDNFQSLQRECETDIAANKYPWER